MRDRRHATRMSQGHPCGQSVDFRVHSGSARKKRPRVLIQHEKGGQSINIDRILGAVSCRPVGNRRAVVLSRKIMTITHRDARASALQHSTSSSDPRF